MLLPSLVFRRNFASDACHRRQYNNKLDDNVTNVFGAKFLRALSPVSISLPEEGAEEVEEEEEQEEDGQGEQKKQGEGGDPHPSGGQKAKNTERRIWGMVSKAGEGVGRSDNDRQFLYLNGRPVDLPKVSERLASVTTFLCEFTQKAVRFKSLPHNKHSPSGTFVICLSARCSRQAMYVSG